MYLLATSPAHMCSYSKTAVARYETYYALNGGSEVAGGQDLSNLGYPWNMTETAQGHTYTTTGSQILQYANQGASAESHDSSLSHTPNAPTTADEAPRARPRARS